MNPKTIIMCIILLTLNLSNFVRFVSFANTVSISAIKVPEDYPTIQSAINNALQGDTIIVANGTYNEQLTINKSITLIGAGIDQTILNGTLTTANQIAADNVTVKGFTIQKFRTGIIVNRSRNICITESRITQTLTKGATYLLDSENINLNANIITNNSGPGVNMFKSNLTKFSGNTISHNGGVGIYFENCTNFTAIGNQIESNGGDAICCTYAYDLYIERNTFALNDYRGIWAAHSNGKAFHNNFVQNRENARSILSNITWDDGYPSGGNYWSNYSGSDLYYGVGQNIVGSDGVGDVPFTIPQQGERDAYPLMGSFTTRATTVAAQNFTIDFISNSVTNDLYINQSGKSLHFTVNTHAKTQGFCRVTIPKSLMWCDTLGQWATQIDGNLTEHTITENDNYTYIYLTFNQGTHSAEITSTHIIPENDMLTPLILFACAILIIVCTKPKKDENRHLAPWKFANTTQNISS